MNRSSDSRPDGRPPTDPLPLPAGTGEQACYVDAPPGGGANAPPPADTEQQTAKLRAELAERTADLQRVKAEYDNYRKRVQRDRLAVREIAVANVLHRLLPVLDAIDQARELGEVSGGFRLVADALQAELAALGLRSFGAPGELFDPERHEAIFHMHSTGVDRAVCGEILARGYRVGDHLLRPAQVTVTEPPAGDMR